MKDVSETAKNEAKEQKDGFHRMLLSTLGSSLLGNLLTSKGVKPEVPGRGVITAGKVNIRAGQDF